VRNLYRPPRGGRLRSLFGNLVTDESAVVPLRLHLEDGITVLHLEDGTSPFELE
jgi:hypothetical protein